QIVKLLPCASGVERPEYAHRRSEPGSAVLYLQIRIRHVRDLPQTFLPVGKIIATESPCPFPESSSRPPWQVMTALARLRPRPEPGWLRLASSRTKRSVARSRSSAGMPGPLSVTTSRTAFASRTSDTV